MDMEENFKMLSLETQKCQDKETPTAILELTSCFWGRGQLMFLNVQNGKADRFVIVK